MLTMQPTARNEVVVAAPPEAVWAVLTDVTRVGEWSHEARAARWFDDERGLGARFGGANRSGLARWSKVCTITEYDAPHRFAYATAETFVDRASTSWEFDLIAVEGGTRMCQSYRVLTFARSREILLSLLLPAHRDRSAALRADLVRLGEVAAADVRNGSRGGTQDEP